MIQGNFLYDSTVYVLDLDRVTDNCYLILRGKNNVKWEGCHKYLKSFGPLINREVDSNYYTLPLMYLWSKGPIPCVFFLIYSHISEPVFHTPIISFSWKWSPSFIQV